MKKRLLSFLLTIVFSLTSIMPGFAAAAESDDASIPVESKAEIVASNSVPSGSIGLGLSASDKISAMELMLYGTEQHGALIARMDSLEDDVYGTITSDQIFTRIDHLYEYLKGSPDSTEASFMTKLDAIEWQISESMSGGAAKTRIESVETLLNGKVSDGSLSSRLEELAGLAFTDGMVQVEVVTLPKDTPVKIEFTKELSSRVARAGDPVAFKVADNVFVNDILVLPKGSMGVGTVKKVVQPGSFGRDARIDVNFDSVYAIDGSKIPVFLGKIAEQAAETAAGAAGASIGAMIVLGPVGAIGGAFVTGKAVVMPVGSTTFVQTTEDSTVQGMVYQQR